MVAANSLQKLTSQVRVARTALASFLRTFSSDALIEVKPGEVGMVSGIPEEHLRRRVVIYSLLELLLNKDLENFDSEEAAKSFAERHGWDYVVKKRQTTVLKPKSYADNFKRKGPAVSAK